MLVIRMQRTGRKGHAQFRVVVQDSRRTPTSGRVVASLGNFNPHTKIANVDKEKAAFYLQHGAQPSDRVARLLKAEGVKLPKWVQLEGKKAGATRHPEKLRKNQPEAPTEDTPTVEETSAPADEAADATEEAPSAEASAEETVAEPAEPVVEEPAEA
jgi:small subunit ribosomal protein S16